MGLRVTEGEERMGLDLSQHNESALCLRAGLRRVGHCAGMRLLSCVQTGFREGLNS